MVKIKKNKIDDNKELKEKSEPMILGVIDGVKIIIENPEAMPIAKEKWNKILAELLNDYTESSK